MEHEKLKSAKNDLWEMEQSLNRRSRIETILKLYVAIGALAGFLSLSYFLLSLISIELSETQMLTLLAGGISVTVSVISWVFLVFRRQREKEELDKIKAFQRAAKIIQLWSEFEFLAKHTLALKGVDFNSKSIRTTIFALHEAGIIDGSDFMVIEEAMQVRNALAHSHIGSPVDGDTIDEVYRSLMKVIRKLAV
ncbi:hypothetical protein F7U75_21445 [Vibrio vulnificus]|nr:hypothetical protein [Vibrio vulnificus]HAS8119967.1 hypothetical protein [Vibrio vulnificus]